MSADFSPASQQVPPGTRIKMLRILLNLSRDEFCKRHKLNFNTITSIELDRLKLSAKQLQKILQAFTKEGIVVEETWIREAKGTAPTHAFSEKATSYTHVLEEWMRTFLQSHHTIITSIKGNAMEPFYEDGDFVGGIWSTNPYSLIGKKCIIQVHSTIQVGILLRNRDELVLVPHNTHNSLQILTLATPSTRIAEILWHIKRHAYPVAEISSLPTLRRAFPVESSS